MKKQFRALIIDDERLARKELNSMLAGYDNIIVVGQADDVPSAIKAIRKLEPDVVFLDIQMPGASGFDLLDQMDLKAKIIFVTAFDEYAIRAFEANALDYLLKPVHPNRLQRSIERLAEKETSKLEALRKLKYDDRLFLIIDNQYKFLKINTILSISAAGDYSVVMTENCKKELALKSMKEWERRLPENYFCRIHRSTIINMEYIDHLEKWFNYSFRVYLKGVEQPFILSRRFVSKLKNRFG